MTQFPPPLSGSEQDETLALRPKFNADGLVAAITQDADAGLDERRSAHRHA